MKTKKGKRKSRRPKFEAAKKQIMNMIDSYAVPLAKASGSVKVVEQFGTDLKKLLFSVVEATEEARLAQGWQKKK